MNLRHWLDGDDAAIDSALTQTMIHTVAPGLRAILETASAAVIKDLGCGDDAIAKQIAAELLLHKLAEFLILKELDPADAIRPAMLAAPYVKDFFAPFAEVQHGE